VSYCDQIVTKRGAVGGAQPNDGKPVPGGDADLAAEAIVKATYAIRNGLVRWTISTVATATPPFAMAGCASFAATAPSSRMASA
jgi:hypothetical protein